jgi:hypothetical protein
VKQGEEEIEEDTVHREAGVQYTEKQGCSTQRNRKKLHREASTENQGFSAQRSNGPVYREAGARIKRGCSKHRNRGIVRREAVDTVKRKT